MIDYIKALSKVTPDTIQCNSSSNRSPSLPIGYSVIVALTGLPIGYSVIVALTGLPIGYSVMVFGCHRR